MSDGNWKLREGHADPVFVGGTGRSGTHAMARLLGKHPAFYYFRREMRFHTDRGGFPDLLAGRTTPDQFVEAMRGRFWRRAGADGDPRGLSDKFSQDHYDAALERFRRDAEADLRGACAGLMRALLDPLAREAGKAVWIEQTPPTIAAAPTLHAVFPTMKMIHMVRDGRDVACSVVRKAWGPSSVTAAISWWEERLRACDAATRQIPEDRYQIVHLEELVAGDRRRMYRRLLRFLGVERERFTRQHFDQKMTPEAARIGRWRSDLSESEQVKVSRLYRRSLERMERDGITSAPSLESADMPAGLEDDSWLDRARASLGR